MRRAKLVRTTSNYEDEIVIRFMDLDGNGSTDDNMFSFPRAGLVSTHDDSLPFTTKLTYELDPSVTSMPTIEGYGYWFAVSSPSSYNTTYSTSFLTTESYTARTDTWWYNRSYTAG